MIQFLANDLWYEIESLAKKANIKKAAIAYVTDDSIVRFSKGDVLLVDASEDAIRTGQTSAIVLAAAFQRGAQVYSMPKLHSKILIFDNIVLISSANLSKFSRDTLKEAGIIADSSILLKDSLSFISALKRCSERVDKRFLSNILALPVDKNRGKDHDGSVHEHSVKKSKPSLLEALQNDDPNLDDYVITFYEPKAKLKEKEIRQKARKDKIELPKAERWIWYENEVDPQLLKSVSKIFERRGKKQLNFEVAAKKERIVKFLSLDNTSQIYFHKLRFGKTLVTIFFIDKNSPFLLRGSAGLKLCKELTRTIQNDPDLGEKLFNKAGWVFTPEEFKSLFKLR